MKITKLLKFTDYDRGNVRAYFKHGRDIYCFQPCYGLQFLHCSRDGEPSHQVCPLKFDDLSFTGFKGKEVWKWNNIHEYFRVSLSDGDISRKMNSLWGQ